MLHLLITRLHINQQCMSMALDHGLAPRGMQFDLKCTMLSMTDNIKDSWDGILSKASLDLVQLASKQHLHQ